MIRGHGRILGNARIRLGRLAEHHYGNRKDHGPQDRESQPSIPRVIWQTRVDADPPSLLDGVPGRHLSVGRRRIANRAKLRQGRNRRD